MFTFNHTSSIADYDEFNPFIRETKKCQPFSQVPIKLYTKTIGKFNSNHEVYITPKADFLTYVWLRIEISEVFLEDYFQKDYRIRWTDNLMHNLISSCTLNKNDIEIEYIDNYILDFWSAFTTEEGKKYGYEKMIGNTIPYSTNIDKIILNLPLPFYFTRQTELSIPLKKYVNEIWSIKYNFRCWKKLLIMEHKNTGEKINIYDYHLKKRPKITSCETWGNFIIRNNKDNNKYKTIDNNTIIETFSKPILYPIKDEFTSIFLDNFGPITNAIFFGCRNIEYHNVWSNYKNIYDCDPIKLSSIHYEYKKKYIKRTPEMQSDYYTLVEPYFNAESIPSTGYHMYSFSKNIKKIDIEGSSGKNIPTIFNCKTDNYSAYLLVIFSLYYKKIN